MLTDEERKRLNGVSIRINREGVSIPSGLDKIERFPHKKWSEHILSRIFRLVIPSMGIPIEADDVTVAISTAAVTMSVNHV